MGELFLFVSAPEDDGNRADGASGDQSGLQIAGPAGPQLPSGRKPNVHVSGPEVVQVEGAV